MMVRPLVLAAAAGLVLATPAAAQQQATEQENLDCAIWATYNLGMAGNEAMQSGLAVAVAWFIGLYEGQAGKNIDAAMAARTAEMDEAMINALTMPCSGRFLDFADRVSKRGKGLRAGGQ